MVKSISIPYCAIGCLLNNLRHDWVYTPESLKSFAQVPSEVAAALRLRVDEIVAGIMKAVRREQQAL